MATTLCSPVTLVATTAVPETEARKHLQRLLRKLMHVLVVKRCIDDLRNNVSLQRGADDLFQKTQDILNELPDSSTTLQNIRSSDRPISNLDPKLEKTTSASFVKDVLADSIWKQLLEAPGLKGNFNSLESVLDTYISRTYDAVRKYKQRIIGYSVDSWTNWNKTGEPPSRDNFWISWAKKRGFSVGDSRCHSLLLKVLEKADEELGQLSIVQEHLDAYIRRYGRHVERLGEVVNRLRAVFRVGWFFEWPSGRHPLNSTWPWADVKPSLLVLWGVCWMFFPSFYGIPYCLEQPQVPSGPLTHANYGNHVEYSLATPNRPYPAVNSSNMGYGVPLLPGQNLASRQQIVSARQLIPTMQGYSDPAYSNGLRCPGSGTAFNRNNTTMTEGSQSFGGTQGSSGITWPLSSCVVAPHNGRFSGARDSLEHPRDVAEQSSWLYLTQSKTPDSLGENSDPHQAATLPSINSRSIPNPQLPLQEFPPSISSSMPSSTFSYPPLDSITEMHDPRPYMVDPERAYQQMPEPHEYDQHHDPQQDQSRYPSPPPPLSEHPYNTQQGVDGVTDGRMDMQMETKSESDAPTPGRSKPVQKPDREVTKDANGRFYCNWPNCTEEVKDFGRKCEWSKHMDKHDRPYKCPADGCEKLPGFTYSGGLLRHEREVHNKHGGPRKQLNCPHPNCKRHTGKGFSRQENLNEHLRRVHTDTGLPLNGEETEDDGVEAQLGVRRKRGRGDSADLREEMKRLKQENEDLKRQAEAQNAQSAEMMRQIMQLQQAQQLQATMQHPRMQAPPAQMT